VPLRGSPAAFCAEADAAINKHAAKFRRDSFVKTRGY
jgi:hypothetical protein